MNVDIAYIVFAAASLLAFRLCRPAVAVLAVFLGGWILLPVGHYPAGSASAPFPYWIVGLALPSDMLLTKAWIAPAAALLGTAVFDRSTLLGFRPSWLDLPIVLWCAWPIVAAPFVAGPRPAPVLSALYLAGCWGLPWLLGRLHFATPAGHRLLAEGLAWSGLACLPIALVEGVWGPGLYGWLYEPHPFRFDGHERYVGYRPIGFFENGNQYGLWIALCALAAMWLAATASASTRRRWQAVAGALVVSTLAAQSVGAIVLLGLGAVALATRRRAWPRRAAGAAVLVVAVAGTAYLAGAVPLARIAKETAAGQRVVDAFRSVGRGSFTWRIGQDQKLLADAMRSPVTGSQQWDWWRSKAIRPWGLPLLVVGQLGLIGLALGLAAVLGPVVAAGRPMSTSGDERAVGLPLLMQSLVVLALVDALLNSFVFFPAIVAAASLVGRTRRGVAGRSVA